MKPFEKPVFVTRPMLPDLHLVNKKLEDIWESQWLTNGGAQHTMLEKKLCEALKVPGLSLFNNGTIALIVALQCLQLKGKVITTPFTFPATTHVLSWNSLTPVFCDIDDKTMNLDPDRIEELITPDTSAILAVHVFGTPCDVEKIQKIADRHGLKVIYDAAHAFGVELGGKGIASFGDISMFSFHSTKLFHTVEGGALAFNDVSLKQKIDLLKNFGIKNEEEVIFPGINGKMNEVQAAIGLINLEYVEGEMEKRRLITETYGKCLEKTDGITPVMPRTGIRNSYQYFVVRINREKFGLSRNDVYDKLKEYNIFARKYFYPLCSNFECYKGLPSSEPANLKTANKVVEEVLCLPLYGGMSVSDAEKISAILSGMKA